MEPWTLLDGVAPSALNQRLASEEVDRSTLARLVAEGSDRDKQRLNRLDCEHANSWITALPSATDGKDTILPPKVFITAVCRLLGLPVYPKNLPCPLCMQTMDIYGDHALCCKRTGDIIARHNRVRNWVFKLADVALLNGDGETWLIGSGGCYQTPSGRRVAALVEIWQRPCNRRGGDLPRGAFAYERRIPL